MRRARTHGFVSLARALSKVGAASRSEAKALVEAGRVAVNGRRVLDPERPVQPERDRLSVDGVAVSRERWRMLAVHKPRGVVTTRRDPEGRPTIFDILPDDARRLVAVGRLDLATSGLLLLTNDTHLAAWLADPAQAIPRTYLVTVRGRMDEVSARAMVEGIGDRGEQLAADDVRLRKVSNRESHLVIVLTEGRNREVRRLCAAVGHPVTKLARVAFGGLELGPLPPRGMRELTAADVRRLFPGAPVRG